MNYFILFLCFFCFGFTEDNTIKRTEPEYNYQYTGQKDTYKDSIEQWKNDPEVLVSAPKKKQKIKYIVIHAKPRVEKPVTITRYLTEE